MPTLIRTKGAGPPHSTYIFVERDSSSARFFDLFRRLREGPPPCLTATDAIITDLDWVIEVFSDFRSEMYAHRNSLLPVNALPDEILLRIFNFVAPMGEFYEDFGRKSAHTLAFSQVCHAWRKLALSAPLLWIAPMLRRSRSEVAVQMLTRSQDMPLIVTGSMDEFSTSLLGYVFERGLPIQKMYLSGSSVALCILEDLPYTPLHLTTLVLSSDDLCHYQSLFQGPAPQLEIMRLYDCTIHWSSPLYTSLSVLKMDMSDVPRELKMRLSGLLATFEHAPALRRVYLENIIHHDSLSEEISLPGGPIRLNQVEKLLIHDDLLAAIVLLQHLFIPQTAIIKLRTSWMYEATEPSKHGVDVAMDYLASRMSNGASLKALSFDADDHVRVTARDKDEAQDCYEVDIRLQDQEEDYNEDAPTPAYILHAAVQRLPMRDLLSFSLHNDFSDDFNYQILDISAAFKKAINMRTLRLSGAAAILGLLALFHSCSESPPRSPHLTDLILSQVDVLDTMAISDTTVSVIDCLEHVLLKYYNSGWPIQRLTLQNCAKGDSKNPHKLAELIKQRCGSSVAHITVSSGSKDGPQSEFDEDG
jgi:hypothetical protein